MKTYLVIGLSCLLILSSALHAAELTPSEESDLIAAIEARDNAKLAPFLSKDADLSAYLIDAIQYGNLEALDLLIDNGADVNVRSDNGDTPLHFLARTPLDTTDTLRASDWATDADIAQLIETRTQHLDMIDMLVKRGADLNAVNVENETPIFLAFAANKPMIVDYFIAKKADPMVGKNLFQSNTAGLIDTSYLKYLLDYGYRATVDEADTSTPLHQLISTSADTDKIDLFLAYGADINAVDKHGQTVLAASVFSRHKNPNVIAKTLLSKGAKPTSAYIKARLHQAIIARDEQAVTRIIEDSPNLVNGADANGLTPLVLASRGSLKFVRILLDHSAQLNQRSNGLNALDEAIRTDYDYIAKYLLKQGIDVNVYKDEKRKKNPLNSPALSMAIDNNNVDMVALLLENKATTNFDGPTDQHPLVAAVYNQNLAIVKLLVDHGAKTNLKTDAGSLIDFAIDNNAQDITDYLRSLGVK